MLNEVQARLLGQIKQLGEEKEALARQLQAVQGA